MNIHSDFEEFLRLLNDEKAEFLIIGDYAVAFHGYPRLTDDLDVFFRNTHENVGKLRCALEHFGLPTTEEQAREFTDPGSIIRLGIAPFRIEMMNDISGITFEDAWDQKVDGKFGTTSVWFISLPDLLTNKRASARPKDLADIDE